MPRGSARAHPEAYREFCARLRTLRAERKLKQEEVAAAIGLSRPQYTAIETGRCMVTFDQVCRIAVAFRTPLHHLLASTARHIDREIHHRPEGGHGDQTRRRSGVLR